MIISSASDYREAARRKLPRFLFDYIDGGAIMASALWFFLLGFGARYLAPVFAKPMAWRVLDGIIALVMWAIAASLFL